MSADVITELDAWFSVYRCCTSGSKEDTLKWVLGAFNGDGDGAVAGCDGPVPGPVGLATVGTIDAVVLNGVNAVPVRSSGTNPGMKYSWLI